MASGRGDGPLRVFGSGAAGTGAQGQGAPRGPGLQRVPQPRCHPQVGEARALYNIGNVYHAKGKQLSWTAAQDPGHLPPDVREPLRRASEFYE